jgi:hypothetical protein
MGRHYKVSKISGHLTRLAATMIAQLQLKTSWICVENEIQPPQVLWEKCGYEVLTLIKVMNPSTLGTIVAQGRNRMEALQKEKTSFWDVGLFAETASGRDLLRTLAARVIIAEMYDILRSRHSELKAIADLPAGSGKTKQFSEAERR